MTEEKVKQEYYAGKDRDNDEYEEWYKKEFGEHAKIDTIEEMKECCHQYAKLVLYFEDSYTEVYFFDNEIECMLKAIRASRKRGDAYVFYHGELVNQELNYEDKEVRVYGGVNTYSC